jgi:quinol monooxygenase YgiN
MNDPLILFARITPKGEHLAAARQAVLDIVPRTRAEPGCRVFTLHDDRDGGQHLYLYEIWDDQTALDAHYAQPYTRAVFVRYQDWLAAPIEITKLRHLGDTRAETSCSS